MSDKVEPNEIHITNLLEFLQEDILSSGGDGDGIWYSKLYDIKDIRKIIQDYEGNAYADWTVDIVDDDTINWGCDQEWLTITNNLKTFNESPDWIQIKIQY